MSSLEKFWYVVLVEYGPCGGDLAQVTDLVTKAEAERVCKELELAQPEDDKADQGYSVRSIYRCIMSR